MRGHGGLSCAKEESMGRTMEQNLNHACYAGRSHWRHRKEAGGKPMRKMVVVLRRRRPADGGEPVTITVAAEPQAQL